MTSESHMAIRQPFPVVGRMLARFVRNSAEFTNSKREIMNQSYQSASPFYDEMLLGNGQYCSHYRDYRLWLKQADQHTVARKQDEAELLFHRVGITFNVYGQDGGAE